LHGDCLQWFQCPALMSGFIFPRSSTTKKGEEDGCSALPRHVRMLRLAA
jgi:hypothetical protein